jgi:hypothetical protein
LPDLTLTRIDAYIPEELERQRGMTSSNSLALITFNILSTPTKFENNITSFLFYQAHLCIPCAAPAQRARFPDLTLTLIDANTSLPCKSKSMTSSNSHEYIASFFTKR